MITVTTLDTERGEFTEHESKLLELPYTDDFEYSDEYLAARGGAPRYTTDEGGAFEVVTESDGNKVLMQKITEEIHAEEWGSTPSPVTNFGDDRWFNYSVSADVKFAAGDDHEKNYMSVGLRYNLADSGASGWRLQLSESGEWRLRVNLKPIATGTVKLKDGWNNIKISASRNTIRGYVNGELVGEVNETSEGFIMQPAGRAALYSSYYNNCFDNVKIEPVEGEDTYITRLDSTDTGIIYAGDWSHNTMDSFKNYKRTTAKGEVGASFTVDFDGIGIMLVGAEKGDAVIETELDGESLDSGYAVPKTNNRQSFLSVFGLEKKHHTLKVTVKENSVTLDSAEIILDNSDATKLFVPASETVGTEQNVQAVQTEAPAETEATTEQAVPEAAATEFPAAVTEKSDGAFPIVPIAVGAAAAAVIAGTVIAVSKAKKK